MGLDETREDSMPVCRIALTELHNRTQALLKDRFTDREPSVFEEQQATEEVEGQMLQELEAKPVSTPV